MGNRILHTLRANTRSGIRKKLWFALSGILVTLVLFVFFSGYYLVREDDPEHVAWALVLDGQEANMFRTDAAVSLLRQGIVDSIAVSGAQNFRTRHNSEFYVADMLRQGVSPEVLWELRHFALSTKQEALWTIPFFRERGVDTVIIVTSAYHTRRAVNIFNDVAQGSPVFISTNIADAEFRPYDWYLSRESAAIWLVEWTKTVFSFLESFGSDELIEMTKAVPATENFYWKKQLECESSGGIVLEDENPEVIPQGLRDTLDRVMELLEADVQKSGNNTSSDSSSIPKDSAKSVMEPSIPKDTTN